MSNSQLRYSFTDDVREQDAELTIGGELLYYVEKICADRWASYCVIFNRFTFHQIELLRMQA